MTQKQKTTTKARPMVQLINRSRYTLGLTSNPLNAEDPATGPRVMEALDPTSSKDVEADKWDLLKAHDGTAKFIDRRWILAIPRSAPRPDKERYSLVSFGERDALETIGMETEIEALQMMLEATTS